MAIATSGVVIALIGLVTSFWAALGLLMVWGTAVRRHEPDPAGVPERPDPVGAAGDVLSFDSLLASTGGVVIQPALGRAADVWGYGPAYLLTAVIQLFALPFLALEIRRGRKHSGPAADGNHAAVTFRGAASS